MMLYACVKKLYCHLSPFENLGEFRTKCLSPARAAQENSGADEGADASSPVLAGEGGDGTV